jgi:O-antigen/teichoic acid export membrane protein
MNELRTLPKEVAIAIFLKVLLVIIVVISIGLLMVGGVAAYLYVEHYPLSTVITYSVMAWIVFILLLVCLMYRNQSHINQKKARLAHVIQTELLATMALRSVNIILRKWQRKHDQHGS